MFEMPFDLQSMVEKNPPPIPVEVGLDIVDNPSINRDVFYNKINDIDNIPDYELTTLIKDSFKTIIDDVTNKYDAPYINIFINEKFLECFLRAIGSVSPIPLPLKFCCNKLAYDYLTYNKDHENNNVKNLYMNISKAVNKDNVNQLMILNLDSYSATVLALARYSSSKETINVSRLNFVMSGMHSEIMNEQMIVFIYEKLFDHVSDLFEGTMFEVYNEEEEDTVFGEEFMEVYSTISLAILDILNNMTTEQIHQVLLSYVRNYEYRGRPRVRFSLRSISSEYDRITNVITTLDALGFRVA